PTARATSISPCPRGAAATWTRTTRGSRPRTRPACAATAGRAAPTGGGGGDRRPHCGGGGRGGRPPPARGPGGPAGPAGGARAGWGGGGGGRRGPPIGRGAPPPRGAGPRQAATGRKGREPSYSDNDTIKPAGRDSPSCPPKGGPEPPQEANRLTFAGKIT